MDFEFRLKIWNVPVDAKKKRMKTSAYFLTQHNVLKCRYSEVFIYTL